MKLLNFEIDNDRPFFLIAGPCVIESEALALSSAETLKKITDRLGIPFIYKSSFDKRIELRLNPSADQDGSRDCK